MNHKSYSLNTNESVNYFKWLKEVLLCQKCLKNSKINDVVIELPQRNTIVDQEATTNRQSLNYFPNNNKKHIDYVIYYKETPHINSCKEKVQFRTKFFKQLMEEDFDFYYLKQKDVDDENVTHVYVLLNCSLERLMDEAERMEIEMPLKPVGIIFLSVHIYFFFLN